MSDILIKGMEMPKDYSVIVKIFPDGRVGTIPYVQWFKVDLIPGTQVVPVPPHGRLIDADKQDAQIDALIERHLHGYTKSTWDFVCELRDILKRNSTIIPAEEGET